MVTEQTKVTTDIVIHTNAFASSFDSEMCAYMTGELAYSYDDEAPGTKEAEEFQNDYSIPAKMKEAFSGKLEEVQGEYGPQYFETINTPGWFNHGMGQIYQDTPENEIIALAEYKQTMMEYAKEHYTGKDLKDELAEINAKTKVDKYGSEQGIWMTFEMQLDNEHLDFLKQRAYEYAARKNIQILSFEANETILDIKKTVKKLVA